MSAAYHLRKHGPANLEVHLIEAADKLGGHANTLKTDSMSFACDAGELLARAILKAGGSLNVDLLRNARVHGVQSRHVPQFSAVSCRPSGKSLP